MQCILCLGRLTNYVFTLFQLYFLFVVILLYLLLNYRYKFSFLLIVDIYILLCYYIDVVLTVFKAKFIDDFVGIIVFVDNNLLGVVFQYFDIQNQYWLLFFLGILVLALLMVFIWRFLIFNKLNSILLLKLIRLVLIIIMLLILLLYLNFFTS